MADTMNLSWDDDLGDIDEDITDEDVKKAESGGKPPAGKYLCECVDSVPQQYDGDYSCIEAFLKWKILSVIELNGLQVKNDESDEYEDRFIFDAVKLHNAFEKEGTANRRIMVASRLGLVSGNSSKDMWGKDIIGKKAIINYIDNEYTPKGKTIPVKNRKVDFFNGYEAADGIESTDNSPDIDEI